jgi:hypothetical protein
MVQVKRRFEGFKTWLTGRHPFCAVAVVCDQLPQFSAQKHNHLPRVVRTYKTYSPFPDLIIGKVHARPHYPTSAVSMIWPKGNSHSRALLKIRVRSLVCRRAVNRKCRVTRMYLFIRFSVTNEWDGGETCTR